MAAAAEVAKGKKRGRAPSGGPGGRAKVDRADKRQKRDKRVKEDAERRKANEEARKAAAAREAEAARKRQLKKARAAEAYLQQWRDDRESWKFKKQQQIWILSNLLDRKAVGKTMFSSLVVDYLKTVQGQAQQRVRDEAAKIVHDVEVNGNTLADRISKLEKKLEKSSDEQRANVEYKIKSLRAKYKRAKQIVAAIDSVKEDE